MHAEVAMRVTGLRVWPGAAPVDLDVHKGEVLGVAGLDGQGQSEFVRILAGVQAAAEGRVEVRDAVGGYRGVRDLAEAVAAGVTYVSGDRKKAHVINREACLSCGACHDACRVHAVRFFPRHERVEACAQAAH